MARGGKRYERNSRYLSLINKIISFSTSSDYLTILWGWLFSAMGFGILLPFISVYFTTKFGISISDVGIFFLATSILRSGFQAFGGELSDVIGRKNIILFSLFGRSFFLILLAIMESYNFNILIFFILIAFTYIFSAIFQPVTQAAIADSVPEDKFLEGFSIVRISGNLGWIFAPILGGYLFELSTSAYFFGSAIFSIIGGLIFGIFYKNEHQIFRKRKKLPYKYILSNHQFIFFCIVSFFMMLTSSQLLSSLPYYLNHEKGYNTTIIGYIFSINGLTVILFQYLILKILKNKDPLLGMSVGAILYGIGYFMVGIINNIFLFGLLIFIISIAETIILPLAHSSVINFSSKSIYGRYMGFFGIVSVTGWSIGPLLGTQILDFIKEPMTSWGLISCFALLSGIGYYILYRNHKKAHYKSKSHNLQ